MVENLGVGLRCSRQEADITSTSSEFEISLQALQGLLPMIDRQTLAARIESAFPAEDSLAAEPALRHGDECFECSTASAELEQWRRVPVDRSGLAIAAGMQRHLTFEGWRWFASNFLRDIVRDENLSNRIEIESLVYFLSPIDEVAGETLAMLKSPSLVQLEVLVEFHQWLASNEFWRDYAGHDIEAATTFLRDAIAVQDKVG
jgi:hypothetical protein